LEILLAADLAQRDQNCCIASALIYGDSRSVNPAFSPITPGPRNTDVFIDREDEWIQDQEQYGFSAEVNWDVGDLTFTSITAHRAYNGLDNNEFDLNPPGFGNDITRNDADVEQEQFTQEFRVANQGDGPVNYVAGLYYFDQSIVAETDLLVALAAFGGLEGGNVVDRFVDTKSYALFGQLDYNLTDNLVLLTGLRFTSEELDYGFERITNPNGAFPFNPPIQFDGSTSDDAVSGLIGLQYFAGDNMFYATWSRGYKGQAVNVVNGISQVEVDNGFEIADPEVPTNIEIGARTEWLDGRLFVDATLFDTEFDDYQVSVFDPDTNTSGLRNAATLKSTGLELSFSALLTDNLTVNGAATFMDAKFDSFANAPCYPFQGVAGGCVDVDGSGTQNPADTQDLSGNPLRNAPDFSYNLSANYERPVTASGWLFSANSNFYYRDDVTFAFNGDPRQESGSVSRVNAALGLESPNGTTKVSLFAKNLFDQEYPLTVIGADGDPNGSNQFLPYDYARVIGIKLDLSL
jgi:iron complex outermembrane receptor protein